VKINVTTDEVKEAIRWLQDNAYLFFERRPTESHLYTLVYCRDLFLDTWKAQGIERAKDVYKSWVEEYRRSRLR
jgi:hypothetical protein